jgi:hypothetical protein
MDSTGLAQKRKRRTKQEIAAATAAAANTPTDSPAVKARLKKKQQPVVAIVTSEGIQGSFESFSKAPLIAHLDIRSADVVFYDEPFKYNPNLRDLLIEPQPYDSQNQEFGALISDSSVGVEAAAHPASVLGGGGILNALPPPTKEVDINASPAGLDSRASNAGAVAGAVTGTTGTGTGTGTTTGTTAATASTIVSRREYGPQELLVVFAASRHTQAIPERTDISCFWCSHPFEGRPCVIPQACEDGVWKVYGNFCCPSCCLSYLLNQTMDTHIRWERIALMNRLYASSIGGGIYPSPARETLTAFGGIFSISEYRNIIEERRIRVDINFPPMVSILASMDTKPIDFYETSIKNTFVTGGTADRFARAEEGLKLRRTKPLKDRESTLDSVLNISIKTF